MIQSKPPRGGSVSARKYKIYFCYWPGDVTLKVYSSSPLPETEHIKHFCS